MLECAQKLAREEEVARANAREALDGEVASLQTKLSAAQEQIQGMSRVIIETLIIWCRAVLCCDVILTTKWIESIHLAGSCD